MNSTRTSIVLIWAHTGPGALFDLRHCLRSIDQNWIGRYQLLLVGDKAPGFTLLRQDWEKEATTVYPKALDGLRKMWHVINYPEGVLTERFVWQFDDQFYLRPVDVDYLAERVALREMSENDTYTSRVHSQLKLRTWKALREAGLQRVWDFEQHHPPVFERRRMLQLFERFKPMENRLLLKTLYYNWFWPEQPPALVSRMDDRMVHFDGWNTSHHAVPRPPLHATEREQREHYARAVLGKHVLCFQERARHPMLVELIKALYPEPSPFEAVPVAAAPMQIVR